MKILWGIRYWGWMVLTSTVTWIVTGSVILGIIAGVVTAIVLGKDKGP